MLDRIRKDWKHCKEFLTLMNQYEENGTTFNDLSDDKTWLDFEKYREDNMESRPIPFVSTTLVFLMSNYTKTQKSQKYYGCGFGKPCKI